MKRTTFKALVIAESEDKTFARKIKERKLDEKQVKFVNDKLIKFDPKADTDEELKTEVNKQTDLILDDYDSMAEIFGAKKINSKKDDGKA